MSKFKLDGIPYRQNFILFSLDKETKDSNKKNLFFFYNNLLNSIEYNCNNIVQIMYIKDVYNYVYFVHCIILYLYVLYNKIK